MNSIDDCITSRLAAPRFTTTLDPRRRGICCPFRIELGRDNFGRQSGHQVRQAGGHQAGRGVGVELDPLIEPIRADPGTHSDGHSHVFTLHIRHKQSP